MQEVSPMIRMTLSHVLLAKVDAELSEIEQAEQNAEAPVLALLVRHQSGARYNRLLKAQDHLVRRVRRQLVEGRVA